MKILGLLLAALLFAAPAVAETGTASGACAPWNGSAVSILLDNNVQASVFVDLSAVRALQEPAAYVADDEPSDGKAEIADCSSGPCEPKHGTVTLNPPSGDTLSGVIEWHEGDMTTRQDFQATIVEKQTGCG